MDRRTIVITLVTLLLIAAFTSPAYCNDPVRKLGRGACNVCTFFLEFYQQYVETNNESGILAASTWGVLRGVGMSAVRLAVGVYEVATFPIPIPRDYMPILTEPEFFGENIRGD